MKTFSRTQMARRKAPYNADDWHISKWEPNKWVAVLWFPARRTANTIIMKTVQTYLHASIGESFWHPKWLALLVRFQSFPTPSPRFDAKVCTERKHKVAGNLNVQKVD